MTTQTDFDLLLDSWLADGPSELSDRAASRIVNVIEESQRRSAWLPQRETLNRFIVAAGSLASVALVVVIGLGLISSPGLFGTGAAPAPTPTQPATPQLAAFAGDWEATDFPPDSSQLSMAMVELSDGTYEVTIRDDAASVCSGASSTMTGVAHSQGPDTLVIEQPDYTCDDGSDPQALSGPPLEQQLRNLGFTYDFQDDALHDSFGLKWNRAGATAPPVSAEEVVLTGVWEATELDGSHQTMVVTALASGRYEVTIHDDSASVCDGVPSTMTGVAESREPGTLVIERPAYSCDDGSTAQALSGPPLEEQLRNLTFRYDSAPQAMRDSLGVVWTRVTP